MNQPKIIYWVIENYLHTKNEKIETWAEVTQKENITVFV